jgi:DMSO/TMAO reductase YedYZ molybdopterin-dependent catalytic subunit
MQRGLRALVVLATLAWPGMAGAQDAGSFKLTGKVEHPRTVLMAELKAMPATTVKVTQAAGPRRVEAIFTGTLLLGLVKSAGLVDAPGKSGPLQHVVVPRGGDDYAVAISIGELDPAFEGKQVLIAWDRDGKALPSPQIVVPGDAKAGRGVHDVVEIEVH